MVKVWDSETGQNVANLSGHQSDIYSIKMTSDGSYALSVGKDKFIHIWDIRVQKSVDKIDGSQFQQMNDISFTQSQF